MSLAYLFSLSRLVWKANYKAEGYLFRLLSRVPVLGVFSPLSGCTLVMLWCVIHRSNFLTLSGKSFFHFWVVGVIGLPKLTIPFR